ncbi:MAG: hypothetical protein D5R98_07175 [Desulfonatronovibrio sp. MSAO_Bac4]|nr:MAG: hypothetical protein D5R98_07175 [Desulfonatronovibrio sp. MSAO_Bac4]
MSDNKSDPLTVKDLMVGLDEFPAISREALFIEAFHALERANEDFTTGKSKYRTLLIKDDNDRIVGKLSPMDLIQGLEPKYSNIIDPNRLKFKDTLYVITSMKHQKVLWDRPFENLCQTAQNARIKDFLKMPTEGHQVKKEDNIDEALHLFVVGRHDSLFVVEWGKLVGLLLFSDVYEHISRKIKDTCEL